MLLKNLLSENTLGQPITCLVEIHMNKRNSPLQHLLTSCLTLTNIICLTAMPIKTLRNSFRLLDS